VFQVREAAPGEPEPELELEPEPELDALEDGRRAGDGELPGERGRIRRRHAAARTAVHELPGRSPADPEVEERGRLARPEELERVQHRQILHGQHGGSAVAADAYRIVVHRQRPEQAGREDATVEVVQLRARTGLEEIHSYERERAEAARAVGPPHGSMFIVPAANAVVQVRTSGSIFSRV